MFLSLFLLQALVATASSGSALAPLEPQAKLLSTIDEFDQAYHAGEPRRALQQSDSTTSRDSYFKNIKDSLGGFIIGIILIVMAFPVLTYNEGSYVFRLRAINWVKDDLEKQKADSAHKSNLIYTSGELTPGASLLSFPEFGVNQENAVRLKVKVEMYQNYVEVTQTNRQDRIGGGDTTTTNYTVKQKWGDRDLDPNQADPHSAASMTGRPNPEFPQCLGLTRTEQKAVYINDYALSPFMIERLNDWQPVAPPASFLLPQAAWSPSFSAAPSYREDKYLYFPASTRLNHTLAPSSGDMEQGSFGPTVGDLRVSFEVIRPAHYTVLAGLARDGQHMKAQMFQTGAVELATISDDKTQLDTFEVTAIGEFKVPPCCAMGCCKAFNKLGELANDIDMIVPGNKTEEEMIGLMTTAGDQKLKLLRILGFIMFFVGFNLLFAPAVAIVGIVGFVGNLLSVGVWLCALVFAFIMSMATVCLAWLYYRPLKALLLAAFTAGLVFLIQYLASLGNDGEDVTTTMAPATSTLSRPV